MVYKEPNIKSFIQFSEGIFNTSKKSKSNQLYIVKYNSKIKSKFSKNTREYIENYEFKDALSVINLNTSTSRIKKCLIVYGKNKFKNVSIKFGSLVSSKLSDGYWELISDFSKNDAFNFALGWGLDQYKFNNLKNSKNLYLSHNINFNKLRSILAGIFFGKELINIPSSDMGPNALEESFINFSNYYGLNYNIFKGQELIDNFPLIYNVGKASKQKPRLLEMNWNNSHKYPLVILVGKGVCFDTGGLNLKPGQYMRNMKKDMGGAASVLSLSNVILSSKLKINLKVLIPTVDNDIGSGSMRPGDVYNSRSGLKVEIGNTDAEGRLILADTLHYADNFKPKLLIDFATLTGAARVALGPDLPAYYTHSNKLADIIDKSSDKIEDPLWRMPLWKPYESWLNSNVADTNNISTGSFAGSIIAALFLNKFINKTKNWIHIDTYAWRDKNTPGHSSGGDILGIRNLFSTIKDYI